MLSSSVRNSVTLNFRRNDYIYRLNLDLSLSKGFGVLILLLELIAFFAFGLTVAWLILEAVVKGMSSLELTVTTDLLRLRVRLRVRSRSRSRLRLGLPLRNRDNKRESNDRFLLRSSASLRSFNRPRYTSSKAATLAFNSSSCLSFTLALPSALY